MAAGAWRMTREIELSTARACLIELVRGDRPAVTWHLPASKTDATALGRVGGHSLRPTGAQGLARLGVDLRAIQLPGHWGSSAAQGHAREASLDAAAEWARRAGSNLDLESALGQVAELRSEFGELRRGQSTPEGLVDMVLDEVRSEPGRHLLRCELQDTAVRPEDELQLPACAGGSNPVRKVLNRESGVLHAVLVGPPTMPAAAWQQPQSSSEAAEELASRRQRYLRQQRLLNQQLLTFSEDLTIPLGSRAQRPSAPPLCDEVPASARERRPRPAASGAPSRLPSALAAEKAIAFVRGVTERSLAARKAAAPARVLL
ncbi:unnamed protein product [Prorocentrum cordatum]|uniref:Uncharacterized protein n=1 Tax=Prorocentrum cordatum TaxID=2364126 RepID=A0ABN9VFD3_9DINO|nr:unnamed protein product [Polarella glacialis]